MLLRIDTASDTPLFVQLASAVRGEISTGSLRQGSRLPGARDLAASLGISLHTVLRAYQELRDEGLVELRQGRGAVVTDAAARASSLKDQIVALGAKAAELGIGPDALGSLVRDTLRADQA